MTPLRIFAISMSLFALAACATGSGYSGAARQTAGGGVSDAYDMAAGERSVETEEQAARFEDFGHRESVRDHRDFCARYPGDASCDGGVTP